MVIPDREEYLRIDKECEMVKAQIQKLVHKQTLEGFEALCSLLKDENIDALCEKDRDLFVLKRMSMILEQELLNGEERLLFENRSIDDVIEVYETVVLYLRRIEFDLPVELQICLLEYIQEQQLSMICILGIIQAAPYIYRKQKVWQAFCELVEVYC